MLLQKFNIEIRDNKGTKNVVVDHLYKLSDVMKEELPLDDYFLNDKLYALIQTEMTWYADFVNLLAVTVLLHHMNNQHKVSIRIKMLVNEEHTYKGSLKFLDKMGLSS